MIELDAGDWFFILSLIVIGGILILGAWYVRAHPLDEEVCPKCKGTGEAGLCLPCKGRGRIDHRLDPPRRPRP